MSCDQPIVKPGFLKLEKRNQARIMWVSLPSRHLDNLEQVMWREFGITGRKYTQLHDLELDWITQEDILELQAHCVQKGYQLHGVLINEMDNPTIASFFARNAISYTVVELSGRNESIRKALITILKHISSPQ